MKNRTWNIDAPRRLVSLFAVALCFSCANLALAKAQPFILGADISWIPEDEAAGRHRTLSMTLASTKAQQHKLHAGVANRRRPPGPQR
jgi:hypothetical protein